MASFDIVNKVDVQVLDNAINTAKKELLTRFDFKDSKSSIELNKKDFLIQLECENDMQIKQLEDIIINRMIKQGLDVSSLDMEKEHYQSGAMVKKEIKVKQGIDKETAKKIVKDIKDLKMKVEPSIMDDQVRVSAKKIDDLQALMSILRCNKYGLPLQFQNLK
jgi:uncharacterized protein YajQ (UPF0234 family)